MLNLFVGILIFIPGARGQCVPRIQTFNMPADGPVTLTEELRPVDMFRDLFRFFKIIRGEMFYTVNKTVTMTSKGDPACALLAKGIPLDELQNFPGDWEIPLMTNIRIVGSTFTSLTMIVIHWSPRLSSAG